MDASNELIYEANRCRTLPIPGTVSFITSYPTTLRIYRTLASSYWQVRCYFKGKTVIKSLRTASKREAIARAKVFYQSHILSNAKELWLNGSIDITDVEGINSWIKETVLSGAIYQQFSLGQKAGARQGIPLLEKKVVQELSNTHKVEYIAALLVEQEKGRAIRGEISELYAEVITGQLRKKIIPFFNQAPIEEISEVQIHAFWEHLKATQLKPITIVQYLTTLRKLLTLAKNKGWRTDTPDFPVVKRTSQSRGGFTPTEYKMLLRQAQQLRALPAIPIKTTHRNTRHGIYAELPNIPYEFVWLIRFMVNSFVRPSDIKYIMHRHVEVVKSKHAYLRLGLPETKRHKGQIITLPAAVHIYEQLRNYFHKRGLDAPNNYLFLPEIEDRLAAMVLMERYFKKVASEAGVEMGTHGQKRTLYSLRHTAITNKLLYGTGIDLMTLARNARTSIDMIDKHYASELSAELNIDMLHSRRPGKN